jgi:glycosyltransferase involved in cell wall biosynthesis
MPTRTGRRFELAANIDPADDTGDRELLASEGWDLVHPHVEAGTPDSYHEYIRHSRAEFLCPKPIYRDLRTGWFSDRSACYLASGRPVLCEDTGFSEILPTGEGLLSFSDPEEAIAAVAEIDGNYMRHMSAARELAVAACDSRVTLQRMIELCDVPERADFGQQAESGTVVLGSFAHSL